MTCHIHGDLGDIGVSIPMEILWSVYGITANVLAVFETELVKIK